MNKIIYFITLLNLTEFFCYGSAFNTARRLLISSAYDIARRSQISIAIDHRFPSEENFWANPEMLKDIKDLLKSGAQTDSLELHRAARMGDIEVVKLLVEHNFDVIAKDEYGRTPLGRAKSLLEAIQRCKNKPERYVIGSAPTNEKLLNATIEYLENAIAIKDLKACK